MKRRSFLFGCGTAAVALAPPTLAPPTPPAPRVQINSISDVLEVMYSPHVNEVALVGHRDGWLTMIGGSRS